MNQTSLSREVKLKSQEIGVSCLECEGTMVVRNGKHGKFLGCSRFLNCRYTQSWHEYIWEEARESKTVISDYIGIISGKRSCYHCQQFTTVSGLGLTTDNFSSIDYPEVDLIRFTGYDVYIVPWSDAFKQLPDKIQDYILNHYPVKSISKNKDYFNLCEYCGKLQGNFHVYHSEEVGSPFSYFNNSLLMFEKISLGDTQIELVADLTMTISPNCYYLRRAKVKELML